MVGANLVAQAAGSAVDHHAHRAHVEPHQPRGVRIEDPLDGLDLEEVVSRPEAAELTEAPLHGTVAHRVRVGAVQHATVLTPLEVAGDAVPLLHREAGAAREHLPQHGTVREFPHAPGLHAARYDATEPVHQHTQARREGGPVRVACDQEPYAARDVEAHAAGETTPPSSMSVAATPPMGKP